MNRFGKDSVVVNTSVQEGGAIRPVGRTLPLASAASCLPSPDRPPMAGPAPVWLAALQAAGCQARGNGFFHEVRWITVAGCAVYTNFGRYSERIEPLGVTLTPGESLSVSWSPGETGYTLEIRGDAEKCA